MYPYRTDLIPEDGQGRGCLSSTKSARGIIGGGKFVGIHVLHTSYYRYLKTNFGFEKKPVILHAVFYRHQPYLRADVLKFLKLRRTLKQEGSLVSLARATFLKLILNSVYGYTLCKMNHEVSSSFNNCLFDYLFLFFLGRSFQCRSPAACSERTPSLTTRK